MTPPEAARMIEHAFIVTRGDGKLGREEQLVATEMEARGIPFSHFTVKKIHRRQLPLSPRTLVVGDMDCVYGAMKQLRIPIPEADSYPELIRRHLHRKVWESNLGREERRFQEGIPSPAFIKPRGREKRFTGRVFDSEHDFYNVHGVSRREPVYCAEVVSWKSEHRAYVVNGEIRSVDHYDGDEEIAPDRDIVQEAVDALTAAGKAHAGFGIDFGVLSTGETALIEMNDGFALGAYTIDAKNYTDLIVARWEELARMAGREADERP